MQLPAADQFLPGPAPPAAVSSAAVSCILVVVGAIVFRSAQLVAAAGDPFAHVKAFNPSWDAVGALPLIILGFACHTNVSVARACMFRCWVNGTCLPQPAAPTRTPALSRFISTPGTSPLHLLVASHMPPLPQVISVFTELEQQPVIFRISLNSASPGASAAADDAGGTAAAQQPDAAAALRPAGGSNGSWRRRRPKTAKLTGMVAVVALSVGLTAGMYSATGVAAALLLTCKWPGAAPFQAAQEGLPAQACHATLCCHNLSLGAMLTAWHQPAPCLSKSLLKFQFPSSICLCQASWATSLSRTPTPISYSTLTHKTS